MGGFSSYRRPKFEVSRGVTLEIVLNEEELVQLVLVVRTNPAEEREPERGMPSRKSA